MSEYGSAASHSSPVTPKGRMSRFLMPPRFQVGRIAKLALAGLIFASPVAITSCASSGPPQVIVFVNEWPFWSDIPVETSDYDRMWRVVVDALSEHQSIRIMDKESGYLQTEWKRPTPASPEESRYTIRILPDQARIRMGVEVRNLNGTLPSRINNNDQAPWRVIGREIQDRLRTVAIRTTSQVHHG